MTLRSLFFATNPYNMGVYRPKGMQRSLCLFCSQPQQYGCQQTPLDTNSQDLPFWADSGPPGHWLLQGQFFVPNSYNMGVYGLPWTLQSKYAFLCFLRRTRTLWTPRVGEGLSVFILWNPNSMAVYRLDPSHQNLPFWTDLGPNRPQTKSSFPKKLLSFDFLIYTMWAEHD